MSTTTSQSEEAIVLAMDSERYQAMTRADTALLDQLLDERLFYTHSNGEVDTKASYIAAVDKGDFVYTSIEHDNQHVVTAGDTIILVGQMRTEVTIRGVAKALNNAALAVWLNGDAGWRLVAYQTTPLPR
jgi:hypothetical protein